MSEQLTPEEAKQAADQWIKDIEAKTKEVARQALALMRENKKPPEGGESKGADEWEEFERVCRPVVEFLQKRYCTPHHRVIIDWSSAVLVQEMKGFGFKVPD